MSRANLYRLSALAAIASGICIIIGKLLTLLPDPQAGEVFDFFSPLFGLFAILGIYFWQRVQSGRFGAVAFIVVFTGLVLVTALDYFGAFIRLEIPPDVMTQIMEGSTGMVAAFSGLIFLVGEILFGISAIRAGVFPKAAVWLFMIGFIPVPLVEVFPFSIVAAGSVIAGVGIMWWGLSLWSYNAEKRQSLLRPEITSS
jgi:hypothetical protein